MLIVPFTADQPFWAARVAALGVGLPAIRPERLTSTRLAAAIRQLTTDEEMRARVRTLGEQIRQEDGVASAVALIENCLGRGTRPAMTTNRPAV
jgi:sterol 3beta-glucosyltransferase